MYVKSRTIVRWAGHTCDGAAMTPCDATKHVDGNECMACPAGHTCDGTAATKCDAPNYV